MCFIAILLTADERVWQFDVAYELVGARDFWGALSDVRIENWKELTGERKELHRRVVNLGLVLLELARSDRERWQMWWSWASEQVPKDRLAEAIHMVRRRTVELRLSSHAAWRAVRTHLEIEGIPLDSCVEVYTWFTEDLRHTEHVLLMSDGRIFRYLCANGPDVPSPIGPGEVARWVSGWEIADPATLGPFEVLLTAGREILSEA